jgi:hypothetical protein
MNIRILSIAAATAFAITSLGATAPVDAAPFGSAGQAITAQANDLVIQVGKNGGGKWKGHKGKHWNFGKHFKFHIGKAYYPAHYPSYCWETKLVPTKYGYVKKQVFVCY